MSVSNDLLERFCYKKPDSEDFETSRDWMSRPITCGEYTYATNGHIEIRVSARKGFQDGDVAVGKKLDRVIPLVDDAAFKPVGEVAQYPLFEPCPECGGSGRMTDSDGPVRVGIGMAQVDGRYLDMIEWLPGAEIARPGSAESGVPFRFEGGIGVLATLRPELSG